MKVSKERFEEVIGLIAEVASGNFDYSIDVSTTGDELDAVISGVSMLGQELKNSTVSRDFMQSIYQGVVDMLLILNADLSIRNVNAAFEELLGYREAELQGRLFAELVQPAENPTWPTTLARLREQGKCLNEELLFSAKHKQKVPASCSFSYLKNNQNQVDGILIIAKDITALKQAEQELREAKDKAEAANEAKTNFLSTMSHEIRTPMNAVIGFTHLLLNQEPRPDQEEYLKVLKLSADNLLTLINDILDYNKIEAGKVEFEKIDFNFKNFVADISDPLRQVALEKGLQLKLALAPDLPTTLVGDSGRLSQILTNLLSNAIKFTKAGTVVLSAAVNRRTSTQTMVDFAVTDTGIGIPGDKLEAIFERFTQAESDTTREYGGSGLGLTIIKQLLKLQGSDIFVKSEVGQGSTFSFCLAFDNSARLPAEQAEEPAADPKSLKGIKLLVAEDNLINVFLIQQFLEQWEIEFDVAENGAIALELTQTNDYDLILMDLQMPEKDGYEATQAIRELPDAKYQKLPIIALSASAMLDTQDKAFEVGMNDYLTKPFNPDELYNRIAKHCLPVPVT